MGRGEARPPADPAPPGPRVIRVDPATARHRFARMPLPRWSIAMLAGVTALVGAPVKLRVLEFNVLYGGDPRTELGAGHPFQGKPRHEAIAEVIRETKADIVILCETTSGSRARLPALLSDYDAIGDLFVRKALAARPLDGPRPPKHMTGGPGAILKVGPTTELVVFGTHWSPSPDPIERARLASKQGALTPELLQQLAASPPALAAAEATRKAVEPWLKKGAAVIVAGDLNHPSHLDWTARATSLRRWQGGATPAIDWKATRLLAEAGLVDAYRATHPDEVRFPGDTWTPAYPESTPGRRPYSDQYSVRIDFIFTGGPCRPVDAWVVGETGAAAEIPRKTWISDHRAVLAEVEVGE